MNQQSKTSLKNNHSSDDLSIDTWRSIDIDQSLQDAQARIEARVRQEPTNAQQRWVLFEILCVQGLWERALKQLQMAAQLDKSLSAASQTMRTLIRAEHIRGEVFLGQQLPAPVVDRPLWMELLTQANALNVKGEIKQADEIRAQALELAPTQGGVSNLGNFTWLSDSDTRLGPVCEVILSGSYRWLAFSDLQSIELRVPKHLIDLVWRPVLINLKKGTQLGDAPMPAYIPTRYPFSETGTCNTDYVGIKADKLRLSRETAWRDVGETGVFACGQKMWMTQEGDWPFLELREIKFGKNAQLNHIVNSVDL